ncbi:MAG: FAD binding domain-containing protein, partial [Betaproteobacteria bacterium]|nr:FAD binding domain-containing protein [Betaproteobacteria bacterium]
MSATKSRNDVASGNSAADYQHNLVFYINGCKHEIERPAPDALLVDYLRSTEVGLTGTKHSCGQGGCGSCTVTLSRYDEQRRQVVHVAGNSCLRPLCSLDGMQVTTVEGLGSVNTEVSAVQYQIAKCNGSQCGYCTPGFVMNMHSYLLQHQGRELTEKEIQDAFDGSICRCTGFRPILYAMKHFAKDHDRREQEGTPECKVASSMKVKYYKKPRDDFPSQLRVPPRALAYEHRGHKWFRPLSLPQVHALMQAHGEQEIKLVVGNTSVGIPGVRPLHPQVYIDISHVAELHRFEVLDDQLLVGAAVTYSELISGLDEILGRAPERSQGLAALRYMAGRTAGTIVRNVASLAGNTMLVTRNATEGGTPFPSDGFTALCVLGARVRVQLHDLVPSAPMPLLEFIDKYNTDEKFRRQVVILDYCIPISGPTEHIRTYKVALREVNAHSLVNAGLSVKLGKGKVVERAALVFGAIAPIAFHAEKTERYLVGKTWGPAIAEQVSQQLKKEIQGIQKSLPAWYRALPYDGIGDSFRLGVAVAFWYKFYVEVSEKVDPGSIRPEDRSAGVPFERGVSRGSQSFAAPDEGAAAGQPFIKLSAFEQATGEAIYTHDIPVPVRGLQGSFVTSRVASGDFHYCIKTGSGAGKKISASALIAYLREKFGDVFVDYLTCEDIPKNGVNGVPKKNSTPDPYF